MMIKKTLIIVFLFPLVVMAQSPSALFQNAKSQYDNGNVKEALSYVLQAQQALGKTNPKIESLKAYCYADLQDWPNAYLAIHRYVATVPISQTNTDAHKDMLSLKTAITDGIKRVDQDFKAKRDDGRIKEVEAQIVLENKKQAQEAGSLETRSEQKLYRVYGQSDNPQELSRFANIFPKSKAAEAVVKKRNYITLVAEGNEAFKNENYGLAVGKFTSAMAIKNSDSLQKKVTAAIEESYYKAALNSKKLDDYLDYHKKYLTGKYIKIVDSKLMDYYIDAGVQALQQKKYHQVKAHLSQGVWYYLSVSTKQREKYLETLKMAAETMAKMKTEMKEREFYGNVLYLYHEYINYTESMLDPYQPNTEFNELKKQYGKMLERYNEKYKTKF